MFREPIFDKIKLSALAGLLALALGMTAYAAVPDETRTGSICVTLTSEEIGAAISGGSLTLYKVGDVVHDDDWNYSFELTDEFLQSGCSLNDLDKRNGEIARELAIYADENDLEGIAILMVDNEGRAYFTDLYIGLYLLVQTEASEGYYPVNPFIVSVPFYDDASQTYQYINIDAFPKTEPAQKETTPETEPVPEETKPMPEETKPSGSSGHSGSGGGGSGSHSGGSTAGGPGISNDGSESISDVWEFLPMPQTGQGRALMFGIAALIISAIALMALLQIKFNRR